MATEIASRSCQLRKCLSSFESGRSDVNVRQTRMAVSAKCVFRVRRSLIRLRNNCNQVATKKHHRQKPLSDQWILGWDEALKLTPVPPKNKLALRLVIAGVCGVSVGHRHGQEYRHVVGRSEKS